MNLKAFSVATFNLFNLQDPGKPMNSGQTPWTPEEFLLKMQWTVWQLGVVLKPDIVGLQELWSKTALDAVLNYNYGTDDEPKFLKDDYEALSTPANGKKIVCGALVRKGLRTGEPKWEDKFGEAEARPQGGPSRSAVATDQGHNQSIFPAGSAIPGQAARRPDPDRGVRDASEVQAADGRQ